MGRVDFEATCAVLLSVLSASFVIDAVDDSSGLIAEGLKVVLREPELVGVVDQGRSGLDADDLGVLAEGTTPCRVHR